MRPLIRLAMCLALLLPGSALARPVLGYLGSDLLTWTPQEQAARYRAMETLYRTHVIERGPHVHPLLVAARPIDPIFTYAGRNWTVDQYMAAYRVSGLLVLKDGRIVLERYGLGRRPTDRWTSFSVAKSMTSTLVGAAIQDGKIKSLDDQVTTYIPELKGSAYDGVTVRQMLTMTSGVKWSEDYADPKSNVARPSTQVTEPGVNPMVSYLRRLPRAAEPGSRFNYNTGETDLMGVLLSKATGEPLARYASEKIWRPYGMERDAVWAIDRGGQERGGTGISMTLRDYGRLGLFILEGGKAGGKTVVPPWWIGEATRAQISYGAPAPAGYGYYWWVRGPGAYEASGIYGQSITTFRDQGIVIVVNSAWPTATGRELSAARGAFIESLRAAAVGH